MSVCYDHLERPAPIDTDGTHNRDTTTGTQVRRNLQRSLAFKIQKLSNGFRGQQKEYLHKLRAQKEGALGQASWVAVVGWKEGGDLSSDTYVCVCVCVCVCPPQEQFAFLNKADADVITIKDNASDTGFSQAQVAVVDNIDMIVNERCGVSCCGLLASRLVPVLTYAHYRPTYMTTTTTTTGTRRSSASRRASRSWRT